VLRFALCVACGAFAFQQLAVLPGVNWLLAELLVLLAFAWFTHLRHWIGIPSAFVWAHVFALLTSPAVIPNAGEVIELAASGRVVSMVQRTPPTTRFVFEAHSLQGLDGPLNGRWRLRVSWRDAPAIQVGDAWRLPLRLKAVHGYASPGAWDYEGWLYWQGIRYRGYVDLKQRPQRLAGTQCCGLTRLRARIAATIDRLPASAFARGVLRALVVGDRSALSANDRALFSATGTSHLMAISGLHIGLLAGSALLGVSWLWRRVPPLCNRVPARLAGAVAGITAATAYALLAGMSLPTQRALIMLLVFALGLLLRRAHGPLNALALAAVAVLVWHPPSIVTAGFWLSFGAVLAILAALAVAPKEPRWRSAVRIQLVLGIALWPILATFGLPASGMAPLVNLVLVPLFGVVVVPLSLLGTLVLAVFAPIGAWILVALGGLLDLVQAGLAWISLPAWSVDVPAHPGIAGLAAYLLALAWLLAPAGVPLRWAALPLLCVPWLPREPLLGTGEYALHVLDVGQGLSTVVETRRHTLVFDTGPEFPSGFSTARAVLLPFLNRRGTPGIDRLIISHGDKDHAGGLGSLIGQLPVHRIQSGEPDRIEVDAVPCVAGEQWLWDGVAFEFLYPAESGRAAGNNASCVLQIRNQAATVLLTGDIEASAERRLLAAHGPRLCSDLVIAPHHGSRSSSSRALVDATRPAFVVYTAGWANRYGFPAPAVDRRWRAAGAMPLDTARLGTISFLFSSDRGIVGPLAYRERARRYWWHDAGETLPARLAADADRIQRD
jgi:competence protein ComEC